MDSVVLGSIAALVATIVVIGYFTYRFIKIINGKGDSE